MDILEALAEQPPRQTDRLCKVRRWLDSIPDDTAGKDQLVATVEDQDQSSPHYRPVPQTEKILHRLGFAVSVKAVGDHRAKRCICYG